MAVPSIQSGSNNNSSSSSGGKNKSAGLVRRFGGLSISSSRSQSHDKPLPTLPSQLLPQPHQQTPEHADRRKPEIASFPPYLAHLADNPSTSSRPPAAFPVPEPFFGRSHNHSAPNRRPSIYDQHHIEPSRLPPRPPSIPPPYLNQSSSAHGQDANRHPSSLRPAEIQLGSSAKPAYPWELVPQTKTRPPPSPFTSGPPSSTSFQRIGKENRTSSTPPSSEISLNDGLGFTTPHRQQESWPQSSATTRSFASFSPNGSQTIASRPPTKGQCWGIKKDGTRCSRTVRTPAFVSLLAQTAASTPKEAKRKDRQVSAPARLTKGASATNPVVISDSEDDAATKSTPRATSSKLRREEIQLADDIDEAYCYQHVNEANKTTGFYRPGSSHEFIQFKDWFGTIELNDHTQAVLRKRMSKPLTDTDRDERGYLYIYELRDHSTATHVCLKVGRTTNVFRRIGEWRYQCQSKEPLLRSFHPSAEDQGLISGMHAATVEGIQLSHRWESLVHDELGGIGQRVRDPCRDCATRHQEIFLIPRWLGYRDGSQQRQYDGFQVAQKVVLKWMRFVQSLQSAAR